jgi:hypothetical protein
VPSAWSRQSGTPTNATVSPWWHACAHLPEIFKGITIHYIQEHGPESILPNRKHPFSPSLICKVVGTPAGTVLGFKKLDWSSPLFLCLTTMPALGMSTRFRKAASCAAEQHPLK